MSENIVINGITGGTYATVRGGNQPSRTVTAQIVSLQLPNRFQFSEIVDPRADLYINMRDASQATQLGMAIYEYAVGAWTGKEQGGKFIIRNERTNETYKVEYTPEIIGKARELVNGELREIVVRHRKTIIRRRIGDQWSAPIKLSTNVDRAVNTGRVAKITAENWISILAHYITGLKVVAGSGQFNALVLEGYRKRAWERAGGEWWNFPKSINSLCKRSGDAGWVLETHRSGKPASLPVTMDRTTEGKLALAIARQDVVLELPE